MVLLKDLFPVALGGTDFGTKIKNDIIDAYASRGGNLIDLAHSYRQERARGESKSELYFNEYLKLNNNREKFFIVTKGCFPHEYDRNESRISEENLNVDINQSLRDLGIEKIDLYLLHRDNLDIPVSEIVDMMSDLVDKGYTRYIGVSNWSYKRLFVASEYAVNNNKHPFISNQIQYSLAKTSPDLWNDTTLEILSNEDVGIYNQTSYLMMCYSPGGKGILDKINNDDELVLKFADSSNVEIAKRAKIVADQLGISSTALSLSYVKSKLKHSLPIINPSTIEQLNESIDANNIVLDEKICEYLRS